jgi:hypothetical protein
MIKYDLKIPSLLRTYNIKPWEMNVVDLSEIWRFNGTLEHMSFDEMLWSLGIKSPKDDIRGEDVNLVYWVDDDLERIKTYCEKDVKYSIEASKKLFHLIK